MTIEQEFFEAFEIEPELNCKNCLKFNDGESIYGAKGGCYDGSKETKKCYSLYPSITPEIVLKLEEILLNTFQNFKYKTGIENNTYSNGIKGIIGCFCSNKIPFKGNNYFLGRADSYEWAGIGDNRLDALLNLCVKLKDEIQNQVRALFNA